MSECAIGGYSEERGLSTRVPPVPLSFPCSLVSFRMFSLALMHVQHQQPHQIKTQQNQHQSNTNKQNPTLPRISHPS